MSHSLESTEGQSPSAVSPQVKWVRLALWAGFLAGFVDAMVYVTRYYAGGGYFDCTGGVWATLAWDFQHGTFYRPLLAPDGYGGTRYMPLFFMLYGWLLHWVPDVVTAGFLLTQASVVLLAIAVYVTLAELEAPRWSRLPLAGMVTCTTQYQDVSICPRCDYLDAAVAILCLLCCLRAARRGSPNGWLAAVALAVVAFFIKVTEIVVVVVPLVALVRAGRPRAAFTAGAAALAACVGGVVLMQAASGGHFIEGFLATADAATGSGTYAKFWWSFVRAEFWEDPSMGLRFLVALTPWLVRPRIALPWPLQAFALVVLLETLFIHGSRGTTINHNVLLHAICLLVMGCMAARPGAGRRMLVVGGVASVLLVGVMQWDTRMVSGTTWSRHNTGLTRPRAAAIMALLPPGRPCLAVNSIPGLLQGERPFLLDAFNLGFLATRDAGIRKDFRQRVEAQAFGAIVLETQIYSRDAMSPDDPMLTATEAAFWEDQQAGFRVVRESYYVAAVIRPYAVLLPLPRGGGSSRRSPPGPGTR